MAVPTNAFNDFLHRAIAGGVETTLSELSASVQFDSVSYLDQIMELDVLLSANRCSLRPAINKGGDDDGRLLVYGGNEGFGERLLRLCEINEQVDVEFKSTAFVSVRAIREDRPMNPNENEGVLDTLLKAICGFLNKDGGEVFVGVESTGALCGIDFDLNSFEPKDRNFDGWSNRLTDQIISKFFEGESVMRYIDMQRESVAGCEVVRIRVRARAQLSFVRKPGGNYRCFIRQNVRTVEVPIEELPRLIELRARQYP